ncbi:hypothetical protein PTKIN_Ptkin05aG0032100 [Pterospermum kingtungense]
MANPSSIVPYNNPHDTLYPDDILNFLAFQNPTLEDLTTAQEIPFSYPSPIPQSNEQFDETIDPLDDPVIRDFCNEPNEENYQRETDSGTESSNNVSSSPLSVWPSEPVPFVCSCCQVLREIIHTNGTDVIRLEIHGRLGMICHAILHDQTGSTNAVTPGHKYQMFDFCKKNIEEVKQFLTQYCIHQNQAGNIMIKDPLSIFYEALCVGIVWDENMCNNGDFIQPSSSNSVAFHMDQAGNSYNQDKPTKPPLAVQRERTRNLTLKEIENYFHLPIQEAAKKMEFSATVVKKICRKYGLTRWPHRKIQSMEKKISNWASRLTSINDPEERARAENEIESLQREISKFGEGSS